MIHAIMPVGNEANRYLHASLSWLRPMVDNLFCYMDQPTDNSTDMANELASHVVVRGSNGRAVSFMEHEGRFRQQLWNAFEATCTPAIDDWVLAMDADELLVDVEGRHDEGPGAVLGTLRGACAMTNAVGIVLPFAEVFELLTTGRPLVRVDGYWGEIKAPRLFRYRDGGLFKDKVMGCGSAPKYVDKGPVSKEAYGLTILHYGYAVAEDRDQKYLRYSSMDHGHNDAHIRSIQQKPVLKNWEGMFPQVYRGYPKESSCVQ